MRRPGSTGPISTGGGYHRFADLKAVSTVPKIFSGAYAGSPGAVGQKAGDIGLDSDLGGIYIADATAAWKQVYP